MKNIKYLILLLIAFSFTSCDKFLSERPSKSEDILPTTVADMETILAGIWREDCISSALLYTSDDTELYSSMEKAKPNSYAMEDVMSATWDRTLSIGMFKDYMWMYRYQNIFRSNLVFSCLPRVVCTDVEKQRLTSKACFRRAYSYMEMLTIYTLPYCEKNLNELGLVLNKGIAFDSSLERATIEETYNYIETDILEALKIDVDLTNKFGQGSNFRVTKASANALAARFYLLKHDYKNAKKYAQAALTAYGESNIMDYNKFTYLAKEDKGEIEIDGIKIPYTVQYPITYKGYDFTNDWTEDYFIGSVDTGFGGINLSFIPSHDLISCFGADGEKELDARYKYFFVENYLYFKAYPLDVPMYFKGRNYSITVPEMLLTIAECEARDGDYTVAMTKINQLRAKRIDPSGKVNLTAANKDEAIAIVLRERRRELCFTMRLFDIRRYNSNDYAADDVTVTREFFTYNANAVDVTSAVKTYELKPGDRRYAYLIPEGDILAGKGQLLQNTY